MTSYQPGIPTGSVPLNQDYLNIQGNFTQLDTQWKIDHVPLTSATPLTDPNGYHTFVHLVPFSTTTSNPPKNQPVVAAPTTPGFGQLFSAEIADGYSTDTALYFLSGGGRLSQLTSNITISNMTNGNTFLPGGLILQWGTEISVTNGTVIRFSRNFTAVPYSITFSVNNATTGSTYVQAGPNAPTIAQWVYGKSSLPGSDNIFWMAIGK